MIKKTGLVLTSALHAALVWGASDGGAQGLPKFPNPVRFVLQRLNNPKTEVLDKLTGGGGTHNLVQFGCMNDGAGCQGFLASDQEQDNINVKIPVERSDLAVIFSVAKRRFALFQAELGARHLVLKEFGRCDGAKEIPEVDLYVEGLPDPAYDECRVVLEIGHGASFKCKVAQVGKSKRIDVGSPSVPRTVHFPPEAVHVGSPSSYVLRSVHAPSCVCADCIQLLQAAPNYPAPSCPAASPFRVAQPSFNSFQK